MDDEGRRYLRQHGYSAPEFQRITWRGSACLAKIGVVPALVGAGVTETTPAYREAVADLD